MIKAIFYDLDGVLVDACDWHYVAFNKALQDVVGFEISKDDHINIFNGLSTKKKLALLTNQNKLDHKYYDLIWEKKQHYTIETIKELAKFDEIKITLHKYTKKNKIYSACITNSIYETANLMLKLTGQRNYMEFIISNEDVKNIKPHGEGYIRAMVKFGFMPEECLIVEDSPVGKKAAYSTGAHVWEVNSCSDVTLENFIRYINKV